jgi:hypothetical protein
MNQEKQRQHECSCNRGIHSVYKVHCRERYNDANERSIPSEGALDILLSRMSFQKSVLEEETGEIDNHECQ